MAADLEFDGMTSEMTQERFAQLVRAGLPFNPVDGVEITGANLDRLQKGMKFFGWNDPRFVTRAEAQWNGWLVRQDAESVQILVRNGANGLVENVVLFSAENVEGMPSLASMLVMSDAEIAKLRGRDAADAAFDVEEELSIGPVRALEVGAEANGQDSSHKTLEQRWDNDEAVSDDLHYKIIEKNYTDLMAVPKNALTAAEAHYFVSADVSALRNIVNKEARYFAAITMGSNAQDQENYHAELVRQAPEIGLETRAAIEENDRRILVKENRKAQDMRELNAGGSTQGRDSQTGTTAAIEGAVADKRFAVLAPYWKDGLHNWQGIALAKLINQTIKKDKLEEDKEAIARLLAIHPNVSRLGIDIVSEERYLGDSHLKANMAEPRSLLDGSLVRDKEGAYRPAAGGLAVLVDKGESLVLKSKSADGYRAAMELAMAKGWTAIELKGKPAMLANAWLEAKLMGLDVVNYSPTEKDKEAYAARVAKESKLNGVEQSRPMEQAPERVEVRPFVDANGQNQVATVTYTVSYQGGENTSFDNPKDAGKAFAGISGSLFPVVVRSVTRANGMIDTDIVAGTEFAPGANMAVKTVDAVLDHEFSEAVAEVIAEKKALEILTCTSTGAHVGPIVAVEGRRVAQKIGRDPDKVVWHELSKLVGPVPKLGDMADIRYSKGKGLVKGKERAKALDGSERDLSR